MADDAEESTTSDAFADVVSLLAAPLAAGIRSVEQLRHAVDEFVRGVENFNTTMENLNETVGRINRLLDEVEEPVRALLPQVTRTVNAADDLTQRLRDVPVDPAELMSVLAELSQRLAPVAQMAESAGGMFGLRLPSMGRPAADAADGTTEPDLPAE